MHSYPVGFRGNNISGPPFFSFFQPKTTVLQPLLTFSNVKKEILPTELLQSLLNYLKTKDRVDVMTS